MLPRCGRAPAEVWVGVVAVQQARSLSLGAKGKTRRARALGMLCPRSHALCLWHRAGRCRPRGWSGRRRSSRPPLASAPPLTWCGGDGVAPRGTQATHSQPHGRIPVAFTGSRPSRPSRDQAQAACTDSSVVRSLLALPAQLLPALLQHGVWALPQHCHFMPSVPVKPMLAKATTGARVHALGLVRGAGVSMGDACPRTATSCWPRPPPVRESWPRTLGLSRAAHLEHSGPHPLPRR